MLATIILVSVSVIIFAALILSLAWSNTKSELFLSRWPPKTIEKAVIFTFNLTKSPILLRQHETRMCSEVFSLQPDQPISCAIFRNFKHCKREMCAISLGSISWPLLCTSHNEVGIVTCTNPP